MRPLHSTLAKVLDGDLLVHVHCYRADEMHIMLDLAQEFGFKIKAFHHASEAYKLADRLAQEGVAVSTWSDVWGLKLESFDGVAQAASLLTRGNVRATLSSDYYPIQRFLNHFRGIIPGSVGHLPAVFADGHHLFLEPFIDPPHLLGRGPEVVGIELFQQILHT